MFKRQLTECLNFIFNSYANDEQAILYYWNDYDLSMLITLPFANIDEARAWAQQHIFFWQIVKRGEIIESSYD